METKSVICDICHSRVATTKCFVCGKDICDENNFGGKYSNVTVEAIVYNDIVFDICSKIPLIDCCPNCTSILKIIKKDHSEYLQKLFDDYSEYIKTKLLEMMTLYIRR